MSIFKGITACLLLVWLPGLLFSVSHLDPAEKELQEKLKTAAGIEKINLLLDFAGKNVETAPDKSLEYAKEALQMAKELDEPVAVFKALNIVGNWYYINAQYQEAVEYYLESLALEPRIHNKTSIANILTNIGMVYWKLEDYETAEKYHTRALEMRKKTGSTKFYMAATLNNLGLVAQGKGEISKALDYYQKALALYKEASHRRGMSAALYNLSNIASESGNYPMALKYLQEAKAIYKELGLHSQVVNSSMDIGNIYARMQQYEKARNYLEAALQKAKEIKAHSLQQEIYLALSRMYEAKGDFKRAMEYYDQFSQIKASLLDEKDDKQLILMQVKYETQKKENELQLLRKTSESQRLVKIFLVIGVALSLGLLAVLYSQYRTKKQTNQLLGLGEAKYRALFSQAGDAIFLIDGDTVVDCNEKALEMFKLAREQIIGKTGKQEVPGFPEEQRQKALAGQPQRFYRAYTKKDDPGTPMDTMVSLTAVIINNKTLIQAIVHDISARKQLEEEQVKSAKLETTTLIADGIAHDFNNLLAIIMGSLELAKKEAGGDQDITPLLTDLEESTRSAMELSEKFLTIARSEPQQEEILSLEAPLREAVSGVLENSGTGVRCHFEIPGDLWPFTGSIKQVKRVMENLTRNALDAMGPRGQMQVKAANAALNADEVPPLPAGHYVKISVQDNGEGIPQENLDKIFDPYFTTRAEYTRKGLGMGLTIARAIIKRYNGDITVSSQAGSSSTFYIYLPADNRQ